MKKIAVSLVLATLLGLAQARSAVPLVEPDRVALMSGATALTPALVKHAVVRGGARHGWVVAKEEPGRLQLKYNKQDKHEVVVDVSFDATGFLIRYVASTNMKFENATGGPVIHPFYNKWVENLSRAILAESSTLSTAP